MKKAILFDLDGTLLPMDEEKFTKYYFSMLCEITAPLGYKPEDLVHLLKDYFYYEGDIRDNLQVTSMKTSLTLQLGNLEKNVCVFYIPLV